MQKNKEDWVEGPKNIVRVFLILRNIIYLGAHVWLEKVSNVLVVRGWFRPSKTLTEDIRDAAWSDI